MADFQKAVYNIRFMDDMAEGTSEIHRLSPMTKFIVTGLFLMVTVSFGRHELSRLFPLFLYPLLMVILADLPGWQVLKRVLWVEPVIIGIGILNPIIDQHLIQVGGMEISRGWLTFFSIFIKGGLSVSAAIILVATTGMNNIAGTMRRLRIPKIFVIQVMLTYRYINVLVEEVGRIWHAYTLRAPGQKGIKLETWGTLGGQLLLRTFDRAERVYQAMRLRGFNGEYPTGGNMRKTAGMSEFLFLLINVLFLGTVRFVDLPALLERIFG